MSDKALRARWISGNGGALAEGVWRFLHGSSDTLPDGVDEHEGRWDLRGFDLSLVQGPSRGSGGERSGSLDEFRGTRWRGLDLRGARLSHARFSHAVISDCRFDGAACRDWRLWASHVANSTFAGTDLRDSALGTWHEERRNTWRAVEFARTDMRNALALGCVFEGCSFLEARMSGAQFLQATIQGCRFTGPIKDVLFDGRRLPGRPEPGPFAEVDLSEATLQDVEFRGCILDRVILPPGVSIIRNYPTVARRALQLLEGDESTAARMLRAELSMAMKLPGEDTSAGVFNRSDYVTSGGEELAALAERVLTAGPGESTGSISPS